MKYLQLSSVLCCILLLSASILYSQKQTINQNNPLHQKTTPQTLISDHTTHFGHRNCGAMHQHNNIIENNPMMKSAYERAEREVQKYLRDNPQGNTSRAVVTIPIVFHVVHNGDALGTGENIPDAQLLAQLDQLNLDFRALNADFSSVPAEFSGVATDMEIEFCLATVDPSGNPTTGIVRHDLGTASWTLGTFDATAKPATIWDRDLYLNFWTCRFGGADAGTLGYAQFPGGAANTDGVVHAFYSVGSVANPAPSGAPYNLGRTATHEVGHWLGLYHIWGDDGTSCTGSDLVADTPNQAGASSGCPAYPSASCSSNDMTMNYMDYTDDACMYMFTAGQKARADATLAGSRVSLTTAAATKCAVSGPSVSLVNFSPSTQAELTTCSSRVVTAQVQMSQIPSATTTVTIALSGTATGSGDDYTLTSGTTYTFTTGDWSTPQDITIEIEEDAYVEADETIIIEITSVTGSDAIENGNQQITLTLTNDDVAPSSGSGFTTIWSEDFSSPTGWSTGYATGNAQKPEWRTTTGCTGGTTNGEINGETAFIVDNDNGTLYCGYYEYGPVEQAFFWKSVDATGLSNLQVTFDWVCGGEGTVAAPEDYGLLAYRIGGGTFTAVPGTTLIGQTSLQNSTFTLPAALDGQIFDLAWIFITDGDNAATQFGLSIDNIVVEAGTPTDAIQTASNTISGFAEHYLGANQTVHFYDQSTGNIMCTITNGSHDFGCTKVEVDSDGMGTTTWIAGKQVTAKTFKVTPSNPSATASYTIDLYYTDAELGAFVPSTMAKASNSIDGGTNTVSNSEITSFTSTPFADGAYYTASFSTGFSGFALSDGGPLPVELISFYGIEKERSNLLSWTTATEINNSHFILERSHDGETFTSLARIEGNGNTTEIIDYQWEDESPFVISYYRLRQVDYDGQFAYSEVITIYRTNNYIDITSIRPNPTDDKTTITLQAGVNNETTLTLVDMTGKILWTDVFDLNKGNTDVILDLTPYSSGMYLLKVESGTHSLIRKIVKSNTH